MKLFSNKTKKELIAEIEKLEQKNNELRKQLHTKFFSPVRDLGQDDYELLVNEETDAVFKGNKKGDFILVNNYASKLTGYSEDELLGMNISNLFKSKILNQQPLRFDLVLEGQSIKNKRHITKKNGETILIEMTSKKLSDGSLICIMQDLSREDILQKSLSESEERFKEIFNNAADFMILFKLNKKNQPTVNIANNAALTALNYKTEELKGKKVSDIFINETESEYFKFSVKLMQGKRVSFKSAHIKKDGSIFPAEISAKIIKIGNEKYVHTVSRDISERLKAEEKIKKSEEKYRLLFELLPYGGEIVDTKGIITDISPGTAKMLNYTKEELVGKHLSAIIHPEDMLQYKKKFPLLLQGKIQSAEIKMLKKDGSEIIVIRAGQPIKN
ncbi:MAG: PAS domain-containing protein, partial [Bacteroidales bacterium]|nr:PAS domain-containing protein [Bacteroidales bacterium]